MEARAISVVATGAYVPERELTNQYFDEMLGVNVSDWLEKNLQIYARRWCAPDESAADMCEAAANIALERAGLQAKDLDLIIVATDTPEYLTPSTASVVQYRLQAGHAGTFDLNAACAGFVSGLDVGVKYIRTDERIRHVLVIGAYAISKYLDPKDKKTVTLFADGAGAIILQAQPPSETDFFGSELITLGQYFDGMGIFGGGTKIPFSQEVLDEGLHHFKVNYRFPPELNPQVWTRMARNLLEWKGLKPDEVQHYLLTQININSIHKTLKNLGVAKEKAHTAMQRYGYTGSACLAIALDDAIQQGKVNRGDLVMMIGSGSGLTFGSTLFRY